MSSARQLAAILFADIVGYTSLMQQNEELALTKLHQFKHVLHTNVPVCEGKIVQYYGDGCLMVFKNAMDAVTCAKTMQQEFAQPPQVPVRMGLHLGEVVFEEGNVFSDAVNIASRIESMGVPGAVLISDTLRKQIKNKPEFQLTSLGIFDFKNVDDPIEVFALSNSGFPVPDKSTLQGKFKEQKPSRINQIRPYILAITLFAGLTFVAFFLTPGKSANKSQKSVAVLAFTDMSPDKSQEYLGDGIAEDIITELSRLKDLKVIGRTSSFQFKGKDTDLREIGDQLNVTSVLEGSVQKAENKIRITAQLINTKDGTHLWSHQWDREITDIFQIQDEIATGIAEKLKLTLLRNPEKVEMHINPEAYELFLQGRQMNMRASTLPKARDYLLKSLAIDSTYANTYAYLSFVYRSLRLSPDSVLYFAQKALYLDPDNSRAHVAKAHWHVSRQEWIEADKLFHKAYELNPNAEEINSLASFMSSMGQQDEALKLINAALQMDPLSLPVKRTHSQILLRSKKFDEVITTVKKYLEFDSTEIVYKNVLALGYIGKQQFHQALLLWARDHESSGNKELATIYRNADFRTAMLTWVQHSKNKKVISNTPFTRAGVYAMLGDKENTLKNLEIAMAEKEQAVSWIKHDFRFDYIRNEPRFRELYRKLNFDAYDEYRRKLK